MGEKGGHLPTPVGHLPTSVGRTTEKLDFLVKKKNAPYGDSGRFDVTEWSGDIFRIELDPMLRPFCLTE